MMHITENYRGPGISLDTVQENSIDNILNVGPQGGHDLHRQSSFYKPRNPEASPFFRIVRESFEFEKIYPERYEKKYGFWRKVIRSSIDKFLKCGDLKEGFARVKCKDCGEEFFGIFLSPALLLSIVRPETGASACASSEG